MIIRSGGCLCGRVKYSVKGAPLRIGLCHCMDCRKESGSSFATFGIWPPHAFESTGEVRYFQGRGFCPECGSRVFNESSDGEEMEIRVGSLDMAPTDLEPTYELWVKRRENWLPPLPVKQFEEDRIDALP
ncbi:MULTISPECIES: GFA family protein [Rhizobium/Agrobacterium group]|uniref:GFA family protein n=2 Tax=Neorhizobium TaxID=1525371 RepID=A0ABV0M443_9HYPH|nr:MULTISPECIES: GFA family protein [Rhizobium/Agrobacterium group]KGE02384.1 aldehyde-activating protein [Rhizobium sp. YS-1r]MCC2613530.1 GFA family protein [Neorhizobium petrolearium]WGI71849.1 GFA family protein [Neorhizobium petrolearium]